MTLQQAFNCASASPDWIAEKLFLILDRDYKEKEKEIRIKIDRHEKEIEKLKEQLNRCRAEGIEKYIDEAYRKKEQAKKIIMNASKTDDPDKFYEFLSASRGRYFELLNRP